MSCLTEPGPVVLEKKILKFRPCSFAISLLSPLGKRCGPSFEQTLIPITQEYFVPSLVEISPTVLEKTEKCEKGDVHFMTNAKIDEIKKFKVCRLFYRYICLTSKLQYSSRLRFLSSCINIKRSR